MRRMIQISLYLALAASALAGNLLSNGGFEEELGSSNWLQQWGSFTRENWNKPPEGNYAGFIKGKWGGQSESGIIQKARALPGYKYVLSGKFYCDNKWTATNQHLKLEFFNEGYELLLAVTNDLSGLVEGMWIEKGLLCVAPEGTDFIQAVFQVEQAGETGLLGVDNVVLDEREN